MSQQNLSTTAANFKAPADLFATLTVGGTTANLADVQVGEKVTSAGGGFGRVSGVDTVNNKIKVKGAVGAPSTWSGALVFNKSAAAAMTATSLAYTNELKRIDAADGTKKIVTAYTYTLTDRGFEVATSGRLSGRATTPNTIVSAVRFGLSKSQSNDGTTAPVITYTLPADKTYANAEILRFVLESNESLSVSGTPRIAILNFGSGVTEYAVYDPLKSNPNRLVYEYQNNAAVSAAGQIVSVTHDANGATITDIGGNAVTPNWVGQDVTGIILA
jgi:hypothetical protein